jgi:hypothetical protein
LIVHLLPALVKSGGLITRNVVVVTINNYMPRQHLPMLFNCWQVLSSLQPDLGQFTDILGNPERKADRADMPALSPPEKAFRIRRQFDQMLPPVSAGNSSVSC